MVRSPAHHVAHPVPALISGGPVRRRRAQLPMSEGPPGARPSVQHRTDAGRSSAPCATARAVQGPPAYKRAHGADVRRAAPRRRTPLARRRRPRSAAAQPMVVTSVPDAMGGIRMSRRQGSRPRPDDGADGLGHPPGGGAAPRRSHQRRARRCDARAAAERLRTSYGPAPRRPRRAPAFNRAGAARTAAGQCGRLRPRALAQVVLASARGPARSSAIRSRCRSTPRSRS